MVAIIEINPEARQVKLSQVITTFGRSRSCTVTLDHPAISRKHCYILRLSHPGNNTFWLFDGGVNAEGEIVPSSSGIRVKGHRIDNKRLSHGDEIQLPGGIILVFNHVSEFKTTDGKNTLF